MTGSRRGHAAALVTALVMALPVTVAEAAGSAAKLRATVVGAPNEGPLTIELDRWSTDAERAPLLAALAPPAPARASAPPVGAGTGRAGRAARGGARGGAAAPPDPLARLAIAIKAAPTVGYVWTSGITGYSIRYAWRAPGGDGGERIVLVVDRRLGANSPGWPSASKATDAPFTVLELRLDARGAGEARASLNSNVIVDESAQTLALDGGAPSLKVTR